MIGEGPDTAPVTAGVVVVVVPDTPGPPVSLVSTDGCLSTVESAVVSDPLRTPSTGCGPPPSLPPLLCPFLPPSFTSSLPPCPLLPIPLFSPPLPPSLPSSLSSYLLLFLSSLSPTPSSFLTSDLLPCPGVTRPKSTSLFGDTRAGTPSEGRPQGHGTVSAPGLPRDDPEPLPPRSPSPDSGV